MTVLFNDVPITVDTGDRVYRPQASSWNGYNIWIVQQLTDRNSYAPQGANNVTQQIVLQDRTGHIVGGTDLPGTITALGAPSNSGGLGGSGGAFSVRFTDGAEAQNKLNVGVAWFGLSKPSSSLTTYDLYYQSVQISPKDALVLSIDNDEAAFGQKSNVAKLGSAIKDLVDYSWARNANYLSVAYSQRDATAAGKLDVFAGVFDKAGIVKTAFLKLSDNLDQSIAWNYGDNPSGGIDYLYEVNLADRAVLQREVFSISSTGGLTKTTASLQVETGLKDVRAFNWTYTSYTGNADPLLIASAGTDVNGIRSVTLSLVNSSNISTIVNKFTTTNAVDRIQVTGLPDGTNVFAYQDGETIYIQRVNAVGVSVDSEQITVPSYSKFDRLRNISDGTFEVLWREPGSLPNETIVKLQIFDTRSAAINRTGTSVADEIIGTIWNDTINGGTGNDLISPGFGNDSIDGGDGIDTVSYEYINGSNWISLEDGTRNGSDNNSGQVNFDRLSNCENVLGSLGSDNWIKGSSRANYLKGGEKSDTFLPGAGNDTVDGGKDQWGDAVEYGQINDGDAPPSSIQVDLSKGSASDGYGGIDKLIDIENVTITKTINNNNVSGDARNNTISFRDFARGNDTFNGGDGWDNADYSRIKAGSSISITVNSKDQQSVTVSGTDIGTDTLISVEWIRASKGDDSIRLSDYRISFDADEGNDTIIGGTATDNWMAGGKGDDFIDGSQGNSDTIVFDAVWDSVLGQVDLTSVDIDLVKGIATDGLGGTDTFIGIENVSIRRSGAASNILGDNNRNMFSIQEYATKDDTVDGRDGNDVVLYNNLNRTNDGTGLTIDLISGKATGTMIGSDTLVSIENAHGSQDNDIIIMSSSGYVFAESGNDKIIGGSSSNYINGGKGDDTIDGGLGNDSVAYNGLKTDYRVTKTSDGYLVTDLRPSSPDGTDTLKNIERLFFWNNDSTNLSTLASIQPWSGAIVISNPGEHIYRPQLQTWNWGNGGYWSSSTFWTVATQTASSYTQNGPNQIQQQVLIQDSAGEFTASLKFPSFQTLSGLNGPTNNYLGGSAGNYMLRFGSNGSAVDLGLFWMDLRDVSSKNYDVNYQRVGIKPIDAINANDEITLNGNKVNLINYSSLVDWAGDRPYSNADHFTFVAAQSDTSNALTAEVTAYALDGTRLLSPFKLNNGKSFAASDAWNYSFRTKNGSNNQYEYYFETTDGAKKSISRSLLNLDLSTGFTEGSSSSLKTEFANIQNFTWTYPNDTNIDAEADLLIAASGVMSDGKNKVLITVAPNAEFSSTNPAIYLDTVNLVRRIQVSTLSDRVTTVVAYQDGGTILIHRVDITGEILDTTRLAIPSTAEFERMRNMTDGVFQIEWREPGASPNETIVKIQMFDTRPTAVNVAAANSADELIGTVFNDTLSGNGGNDVIAGGPGADAMSGGDGIDTLSYFGSTGNIIVDLTTNVASGGDAAGDTLSGFENVIGAKNASNTISGSGAANDLRGGNYNDTLNGQAGNDTIKADSGNDSVIGGDGNDFLEGDRGNDTLTGGNGNDTILADQGDDVVFADAGDDAIIYDGGSDKIDGGTGNDLIDLSSFAGNGTPYTMTNRGAATYFVTGKADAFTITDVINKATITVTGVEKVKIGGVEVTSSDFVGSQPLTVSGREILVSADKQPPSLFKLLDLGEPLDNQPAFATNVSTIIDRVKGETWNSQAFNPEALTTKLAFTSNAGSTIAFEETQKSTTTSFNETVSISLQASPSAVNATDKVTIKSSVEDKWAAPTAAGISTGSWSNSENFSFVDSQGNKDLTDDISVTVVRTDKGTYSNTNSAALTADSNKYSSTISIAYAEKDRKLDVVVSSSGEEAGSVINGVYVKSKNVDTSTITKYSLIDNTDASSTFSFLMAGTVTTNDISFITKYDLKNVVVETNDYKLNTAAISGLYNTSQQDDLFESLNFGWGKPEGISGAKQSLADGFVPLLMKGANAITLKRAGSIAAGDGNDTVTGSEGNDVINAGTGVNVVSGGKGHDSIIYAGGSDKIDGGDGVDVLDLREFGFNQTLYTLSGRGASTYIVSGSDKNFTITDIANKATITVANVEKVWMSDTADAIDVSQFLAKQSVDVDGSDIVSGSDDTKPSINIFLKIDEADQAALPFAKLVDISRFDSEQWGATQAYDANASKTDLTFKGSEGSLIVYNETQQSTSTSFIETKKWAVTAGTGLEYSADNFKGASSTEQKWTAPTAAGVSTGTWNNSLSFSFVDSNGTSDASLVDDRNFAYALTDKGSYTTTVVGGVKIAYAETTTGSSAYSYATTDKSFKLDAALTSASTYAASVVNGNWTESKNTETYTITKYVFEDNTDPDDKFSFSMAGVITQNDLLGTTQYDLKSVVLSSSELKVEAATMSVKQNTFSEESLFQTVNFGWKDGFFDGIDHARQSLTENLAPLVLQGSNKITLNIAAEIDGGQGNDTIIGSTGDDTIDGGFGSDSISAGSGDDEIIYASGSDQIDGGAGDHDLLNLTSFGFNGNAYSSKGRGSSTYIVTGKASDFTITDVANKATLVVKNVEYIKMDDSPFEITASDFVAQQTVQVSASDILVENDSTKPAINIFLKVDDSDHGPTIFGSLVNLERINNESWSGSQSYDAGAATTKLSFTSNSGSQITYTDTQKATSTSFNETSSWAVAAGSSSNYSKDLFSGTWSTEQKWSAPTAAGISSGTWSNTTSFSFTDSNGSVSVSDDISFTTKLTDKGSYSLTMVGGVQTAYSETTSGTAAYNYKSQIGDCLVDVALTSASTFSATKVDGDWVESKNSSTYTITKYAFVDNTASSDKFSFSMTGTVTQNDVAGTTQYDLKSVTVDMTAYKLETKAISFNQQTFSDDSLYETVIFRWGESADGMKQAKSELASELVPLLFNASNVLTLNARTNPFLFNVGSGDDTVNGSSGADWMDGGAGNDNIFGNAGDDRIVYSGGIDKIDGGLGNDTLDLDAYFVMLGYTLKNRGTKTYSISGTATNFTITDNVSKAVVTVGSVEFVIVDGLTYTTSQFINPT
jgi:Ca2+-binding RTX toxin-like protein